MTLRDIVARVNECANSVDPHRCKTCGKYFVGPANKHYCSNQCKDRYRQFINALRRGIKLLEVDIPGLLHCNKCGMFKKDDEFSRRGGSPTTLCKSCKQQSDRRWRRQQAETFGVVIQSRADVLNEKKASLAQKNARQAWMHWLNERAPSWWLDQYWQVTGEPWRDPRLSDTERYRIRYRMDTDFQLKERLRSMTRKRRKHGRINELMRRAINNNSRSVRVYELCGYSIDDLRKHLERQFTKGMDWERFRQGDIHIDHIIPQSEFDLSDPDEVRKCFALTNLRPLWAVDNIRKGKVIETLC